MSFTAGPRTHRLRYFEFPAYWEEKCENLDTASQLLSRLREIELGFKPSEGESITVYVENPDGDTMHVGLAGSEWVLILHKKNRECFVSVGEPEATGYKTFLFPEWTELSRRHLVAVEKATEALRHWFETGALSAGVQWSR